MKSNNQGFVLPVGMIFLVILGILSVSAMKSVRLEEKMAGNYIDKQISFERAESGLMVIQRLDLHQSMENIEAFDGFNNSEENPQGAPDFGTFDWTASSSNYHLSQVELGDLTETVGQSPPVAVLEEIYSTQSLKIGKEPPNKEKALRYIKATVKATGHTEHASTVLQGVIIR